MVDGCNFQIEGVGTAADIPQGNYQGYEPCVLVLLPGSDANIARVAPPGKGVNRHVHPPPPKVKANRLCRVRIRISFTSVWTISSQVKSSFPQNLPFEDVIPWISVHFPWGWR
jgi:hypothetical protein